MKMYQNLGRPKKIPEGLKVGTRHQNRKGYWFTVLEFNGACDVVVKFDSGYTTKTSAQHARIGAVRDRLYPDIVGFGVNDTCRNTGTCLYYRKWYDMLRRCYDPKYLNITQSYRDVYVSEDWRTFSNFKVWVEDQEDDDWYNKVLDKDIICGTENKIYSKDTCIFITQDLNNFMHENVWIRGEFAVGVSLCGRKKELIRARCHNPFGGKNYSKVFSTETEAHDAWRRKKLEYLDRYCTVFNSEERIVKHLNNLRARYLIKG